MNLQEERNLIRTVLMRDGLAHSLAELVVETGMTKKRILAALDHLISKNHVKTVQMSHSSSIRDGENYVHDAGLGYKICDGLDEDTLKHLRLFQRHLNQ